MASVTEAVKESFLGLTEGPHMTYQARANFLRHAQKDENGELYMDEENFIDAVAPKQEDYVSVTRDCKGTKIRYQNLRNCSSGFFPDSTRLSANNMASFSASQTAGELVS